MNKTEQELFWLRCAIQTCHEIELGKKSEGGYCGEQQRKFYAKLNDEGGILSVATPGKCHWITFLGFTEEGRRKYLNEKGDIQEEYQLPV